MPKDPGNLGGGSGGGTGGGTIQVNSSVFVLLILFWLLDYYIVFIYFKDIFITV